MAASMTKQDEVTIDFAKMDGLAPAVVQDAETGQVLMVGSSTK